VAEEILWLRKSGEWMMAMRARRSREVVGPLGRSLKIFGCDVRKSMVLFEVVELLGGGVIEDVVEKEAAQGYLYTFGVGFQDL
jgi:hypothetical protein